MSTVLLTFSDAAYKSACKALARRGIPIGKEFDVNHGPTFDDATVKTERGFVKVTTGDGTVYMYNSNNVMRVKVTNG